MKNIFRVQLLRHPLVVGLILLGVSGGTALIGSRILPENTHKAVFSQNGGDIMAGVAKNVINPEYINSSIAPQNVSNSIVTQNQSGGTNTLVNVNAGPAPSILDWDVGSSTINTFGGGKLSQYLYFDVANPPQVGTPTVVIDGVDPADVGAVIPQRSGTRYYSNGPVPYAGYEVSFSAEQILTTNTIKFGVKY